MRSNARTVVTMSPIPWSAILTHGPAIVASAKRLLATTGASDVRERTQALDVRLDDLHKASAETARVLHDMAQQVQALTEAQRDAARKIRVALAFAVAAAALAIGATILALVN
jgi:hypothetical protein